MRQNHRRVGLTFLSVIAFVIVGIALETEIGLPFAVTYRVTCAALCLYLISKLRSDYPDKHWPRYGFWIALLINIGIFFTPLVDRPASRGELMLFALPDTIVLLVLALKERFGSNPAADDHERAVRQQLVLGLILAVAFCAVIFAVILLAPRPAH